MKGLFRFRSYLLIAVAFAGVGFLASGASAGIIAEQVRYTEGSAKRDVSKLYISKNRLKFNEEGDNTIMIFDLNTGEMIQIDVQGKKYVRAKPKEYFDLVREMREEMKKKMEAQMANLPPEYKAKMEQMMKAQGFDMGEGDSKPRSVKVNKTSQRATIADYSARKFEIYIDGKLDEEVWMTNDATFTNEFDTKKMAKFMSEFRKAGKEMGQGGYFEEQEKLFKEVYSIGFPLKTIEHAESGPSHVEEITKVTTTDIPEKEFLPPDGYRRVTVREMMMAGRGGRGAR